MMRYAFVMIVLAVFLIFFGPSLMAWGRNMARQQKDAWREQEQESYLEVGVDEYVGETDQPDERARVAEGADGSEADDPRA